MKDKPNEWVAISDLMSGVMAIVMLFFIVSSLKGAVDKVKMINEINEIKNQLIEKADREKKLEILVAQYGGQLSEYDQSIKLSAEQQQKLVEMLHNLEGSLSSDFNKNLIHFNIDEAKITLKDNVFSRGSACITNSAQDVVPGLNQMIEKFLKQFPLGRVYIEGHTDNLPVKYPVIDFKRFCTVYDDNYTLSAARARETRKLLLNDKNKESQNRIVVAGFGDSHPIDGIEPSDARNRRVEVRFVLDTQL
ncbi:OmpA family protein [Aliivibrio fischeri]|uniref:OmpA/MotB family protein n=1 Tax=Aliivibrio fischeri TaxID=668 RepID=UPI0012D9EFA8|nr:OmpA family protein [Aliivibrio fischeri]MUK28867.1 OmpA family protein [Aliivibrio fischeri]